MACRENSKRHCDRVWGLGLNDNMEQLTWCCTTVVQHSNQQVGHPIPNQTKTYAFGPSALHQSVHAAIGTVLATRPELCSFSLGIRGKFMISQRVRVPTGRDSGARLIQSMVHLLDMPNSHAIPRGKAGEIWDTRSVLIGNPKP